MLLVATATLLLAMFAQAKDRTIVVRGKGASTSLKTEVTSVGFDTLSVSPGMEAQKLIISIKTLEDGILYQQIVPVCYEDNYSIITPELPGGYFLEVRDDKGFIYKEYTE